MGGGVVQEKREAVEAAGLGCGRIPQALGADASRVAMVGGRCGNRMFFYSP